MGKKENGFFVLMAFLIDIAVGYAWYDTIYSTETMSRFTAVTGGAALMFFSLLALALNILVYSIAIAEGS